jgi:hypothetical protein
MTQIMQRFFALILFILLGISAGFLIEMYLSSRSGELFGHSQTGHEIGWLGLIIILTVFIYSIKKRYRKRLDWPKGWFVVHQIAGVVGPALILLHAGPHFHALVPIFTLAAMGIVVVTGLIGSTVHRKAFSKLKASRQDLLSQGLSGKTLEDRLFDLVAEEKTFRIWQIIHVPMVVIFLALGLLHVFGALFFGGF